MNATDNNGSTALNLTVDDYNDYYVDIVKRLLKAGIHVNRADKALDANALGLILYGLNNYEAAVLILYAAGETLDGTEEDKIPEELLFEEEKLELKHICRETIRKHLLKLDVHSNLFGRIPKLGLPSIVTEYLLFNQSLDDDEDEDADE